LQGIDTRVSMPGVGPADIDAIVLDGMFNRMQESGLFGDSVLSMANGGRYADIRSNDKICMPTEIQSNPNPAELNLFTGGVPYVGEANDVTYLDAATGVLVLRAPVLASRRAAFEFARVKDLAGLIKGHVVASHVKHPILADEQWRASVALSMKRLSRNDLYERTLLDRMLGRVTPYPHWLQELVQVRFKHDAFTDLT